METTGNTKLVEYGILSEGSDIRAHVCVLEKCVYVYPTVSGIETVKSGAYKKAVARQGEIITAVGYLVPPRKIKNCRRVDIPDHIIEKAAFSEFDTTTEKGDKAVRVVKWLLNNGLFPIWTNPNIVEDVDMQIKGVDIELNIGVKIQVKCDYRGGSGNFCTGNLYIQIAECNPHKLK